MGILGQGDQLVADLIEEMDVPEVFGDLLIGHAVQGRLPEFPEEGLHGVDELQRQFCLGLRVTAVEDGAAAAVFFQAAAPEQNDVFFPRETAEVHRCVLFELLMLIGLLHGGEHVVPQGLAHRPAALLLRMLRQGLGAGVEPIRVVPAQNRVHLIQGVAVDLKLGVKGFEHILLGLILIQKSLKSLVLHGAVSFLISARADRLCLLNINTPKNPVRFHGTKKFAEKNQEMKPNPLFRGITYENAPNDE